jgi:hypothetical protein
MNDAISNLIENIKHDYLRWTSGNFTRELSEVNERMIADFNETIRVEEGSKYIKVITGSSVWGFVMKADDAKFKAGDILKAAGWKAPARNAARGNVFEEYSIAWTGPHYLK